jgi:putative aldouronate transport system substrate-binding protein
VLKSFKEKDPAGGGKTIPFSFLYQESPAVNREVKREFEWFFLAFGVPENPKHIAIDDNGQVIFTADKPGFKETIKYLNRLYGEGLIDREIFTQDRTLLTNKIRQLTVGGYTDYRLKSSMAFEDIQDQFAVMPPLKGPNGDRKWLKATIGMSEGAFAITSACKYPEVAMRWLDYINEPEINIQMAFGMFKPEGWDKSEAMLPSKAEPGKYDVNTSLRPKSVQPSDWPMSAPIAESPILSARSVIDKYLAVKPSNVAKVEVCDVYRPYLTRYPYNYPYRFTVKEIEDLSLMQTDLLSYIFRTEAKWIAEGGIDAEWDAYLAKLKNLKVDQYLGMYKTSFERSQKK